LEAASDAGFPVMIFAPEQASDLREGALRYPELRLIIDHLNIGTRVRDEQIDPEITALLPQICRMWR
jgi:hypothetical protein